jgi:TetR/AcrR family transcriptional repressor of lmrAB and yxaGH operons
MIDAAAALFRRQGYDATTWRQVTAASGAPAGSIGFLFPDGKEQLAAEVVHEVSATTRALIDALLLRDDDPVVAIRRWIAASTRVLVDSDYTDGCPIATIALEMAHRSARIQSEIADGYRSWVADIADRLAPTHGPDATDAAEVLLAAFEGALLLSRARRSTEPLDCLNRRIDDILNSMRPPPAQE